ncbi:hypothetical protein N7519_008026 [Penicillium mononematosum]|uniref:uncharacterized protein n=1 Tax=Penicillium mononematosum TaxID=268346 RepID=UPI002548E299|nr:uncharacterized protein N7519_008026 [Penicillium mononematosum]KAJ6186725.1 hypothetical protein N7519_008026 [Penicillium mononematosum]
MSTVASENVKITRVERREETGSRHEVTWSLLLSNLEDYIRFDPGASMSYRQVLSDEIAFAAYQQDS